MCQRKFAEMSSQIYVKEKSNSYSSFSYFGIWLIERSLSITQKKTNYRAMFSDKIEGHMQKFRHFSAKQKNQHKAVILSILQLYTAGAQ